MGSEVYHRFTYKLVNIVMVTFNFFSGALTFAELSTVIPSSGGQYAYFLAAFKDFHPCFGPLAAFSFVWVEVMILAPAATAILSILFVTYLYEPIRVCFYPLSNAEQLKLIKNIAGTLTIR